MKNVSLGSLKACLKELIPDEDSRSTIKPFDFIVVLAFSFLGDSKATSIESIRRSMMAQLNKKIKRHTFWERLSRKRLKLLLWKIVNCLMAKLGSSISILSKATLSQLGVSDILMIDSSTITLWDGSSDKYPGTRTAAGIKWHACFSLITGIMTWFELTPSSTSDRKCFLDFKSLAGKLVLIDLGYWDYSLLLSIQAAGGYFLSRVKSNSAIVIEGIVSGLGSVHIGKKLSEIKRKRGGGMIEISGSILYNGCWESIRVVGFWNPSAKRIHWYCTNLMVSAKLIYPLYRLRWQCELIFKACKNSLNINRITTNNANIIESLILASLVAHLSTSAILEPAISELTEEQVHSISFQRIAKVFALLASDFIRYLRIGCLKALTEKIKLFINELYDPNFKRRKTSLNYVRELLVG